jgi:dCTP deaminase
VTLGPDLIEVRPDLRLDFADPHADVALRHAAFRIPSGGFVIAPGRFYLGHTAEVCGSRVYACTLHADRSAASLGLWIHVSAELGHAGAEVQWTLEIRAAAPVRVRAGMKIGKVAFWPQAGEPAPYAGGYGKQTGPTPSKGSARL